MGVTKPGTVILITGATSGIGLEASAILAGQGAQVVMVGRDAGRLERAVATVRRRTRVTCDSDLCDFSSQHSVRELAARVRRDHPRLTVLVNNAGGVSTRRTTTEDGLETTFATNHLGYFLLTTLLVDVLRSNAPARIVSVASEAHRGGTLDFDDLGLERGYSVLRAYARSKLANVLMARELARRLEGTGVTSNSLHPGTVATNIWSRVPNWFKPVVFAARPFFKSVEVGAGRIVQLAVAPELAGVTGEYFCDGRPVRPSALAEDAARGRRLWDVSEELVRRSAP